jgi:hypothetical protein
MFGKSFNTLKEARVELKKREARRPQRDLEIRYLSKKAHPRRKKRYHVGTYLEWLNFA